ncbi:MAG: lysine--tRNA ligase [Fidelibacterota bacterium]
MSAEKEQSLAQIIQIRKEKVARLREMGINPYPYTFDRTHLAKEILNNYRQLEGKTVSTAGRIISLRRMGKAAFFHVQDDSSKIQVYLKKDLVGDDTFEIFQLLDIGDIVGVKGEVFTTKMGEISIKLTYLTVLSKSIRPLPGSKEKEGTTFHAFADKEQRYRHRHLDLVVNPDIREVFRLRAQIISALRNFLDENGFLEVETPVLQPLYGGAFARPFTTYHHALDRELYLRIADELYLKRLIIGGFDRVYEMAKDFRNEGMDHTHNPEFTMLEYYAAYVDYFFFMDFTEKLIQAAASAVGVKTVQVGSSTIDLFQPYHRAAYMDLLQEATGEEINVTDENQLRSLCKKHGLEIEQGLHLGALFEILMKNLVEPNLLEPTFVIDYPKAISPLAKVKRNDETGEIVERFELFIGGGELANSFSELTDPIDQRERLFAQAELRKSGDEEAQSFDEDFVRAVEVGMPPTGGVGLGVDRLVMLITGQHSIRDVLLFPAMRSLPTDG